MRLIRIVPLTSERLSDAEEEGAFAFAGPSIKFEPIIEADRDKFYLEAKTCPGRFANAEVEIGDCRIHIPDIQKSDPVQNAENREAYFVVE